MQHSKGPWKWIGDAYLDSVDGETVLESADDGAPWGMHSAILRHHWNEETKEANKRLIAAAPKLLEACKAIETFYVFFDSWTPPSLGKGAREALGMVRAAIREAEKHE